MQKRLSQNLRSAKYLHKYAPARNVKRHGGYISFYLRTRLFGDVKYFEYRNPSFLSILRFIHSRWRSARQEFSPITCFVTTLNRSRVCGRWIPNDHRFVRFYGKSSLEHFSIRFEIKIDSALRLGNAFQAYERSNAPRLGIDLLPYFRHLFKRTTTKKERTARTFTTL